MYPIRLPTAKSQLVVAIAFLSVVVALDLAGPNQALGASQHLFPAITVNQRTHPARCPKRRRAKRSTKPALLKRTAGNEACSARHSDRSNHSPDPVQPVSPLPNATIGTGPDPAPGSPDPSDNFQPFGEPKAGQETPAESPASMEPPAPFRFFSPTSFWNQPLPTDAPLDPSSAAEVSALDEEINKEEEASKYMAINTTTWSVPIYTVPADQPTVKVTLENASSAPALQSAWEAVPLPPNAQPAAGSDEQLVVWQPSTDRLWEFWGLEDTDRRLACLLGRSDAECVVRLGRLRSRSLAWCEAKLGCECVLTVDRRWADHVGRSRNGSDQPCAGDRDS